MKCPHCASAENSPATVGRYSAECMGCTARQLALSPMAHKASGGDPAPLQEAMHKAFGKDYRAGRVAVWGWVGKIEKAKATA